MAVPRWKWSLVVAVGALAGVAILYTSVVPLSSEMLRREIVATLSARLESKVELGGLRLRTFPRLHVEGEGLKIASLVDPERPIIAVDRFAADGDLAGLMRHHVGRVELVGLTITIPPDRDKAPDANSADRANRSRQSSDEGAAAHDVVIDDLVSSEARLILLRADPEKPARTWAIHHLLMHNVGIATAMPFEATLSNAVPPGEIHTTGRFGPWHADAPGRTPVDGAFTFDHADLSVFHGISGILSARGRLAGSLGRIDIHGQTDTPQFTLSLTGHPVPLKATYHAIVDGTNGDTRLERIDASFLDTSLVARGDVFDTPGPGRIVRLDVDMDKARLEDVLRLAVKTPKPTMTGGLKLTTTFLLPPGDTDVASRLRLEGAFQLDDASFTDPGVQAKINDLSRRGRGKPGDGPKPFAASDFAGRFKLAGGILSLPVVTFVTPGAAVRLAGRYALRSETLDFRGTLSMDAKVSDTTGGMKHFVLKVIDPLFNKDGGGSRIPIRIGGTRKDPDFGLDTRRVFAKKN